MHRPQNSEECPSSPLPAWTLVTSHGLVLLYAATKADVTIREVASALDLTERRVADVIRDLRSAGLLTVQKDGRRNRYQLNPDARFLHPVISTIPFKAFVSLVRAYGADVDLVGIGSSSDFEAS